MIPRTGRGEGVPSDLPFSQIGPFKIARFSALNQIFFHTDFHSTPVLNSFVNLSLP